MDQTLIEFAARCVIAQATLPLVLVSLFLGTIILVMVALKIEEALFRYFSRS